MSPLDQLAEALEGRIGRQMLNALRALQLGLNLRLIERLILQRQIEEIVKAVGWEHLQNVLAQAQRDLVTVQELAWQTEIQALPRRVTARVPVRLSLGAHAQANPAVLEGLTRQNLSRLQGITRDSQEAVRRVLIEGFRAGRNPRDIAQGLRGVIGLTPRQAVALDRFRTALTREAQAKVETALAEGRGRVAADRLMAREVASIDRAVARRQQAMLATRAETIARTEVMQAIGDGKRLQRERLVAEGALQPGEWEQEWRTAEDERVCPVCLPLDGSRAPIGGRFPDGSLGPPAHPRCRCDSVLTAKGFRQGEPPAPARRAVLASLR